MNTSGRSTSKFNFNSIATGGDLFVIGLFNFHVQFCALTSDLHDAGPL